MGYPESMIKQLKLKDYILIDELTANFDAGLNVITGETGSGKSILISAIDLAFAPRVSKEVIKTGCEKAVIELVIDNQSFTRLSEDSFLSDYNITPLPWLRMKKGTHKGTLIYEIPDTLQKERMSLTYKDQPIDK